MTKGLAIRGRAWVFGDDVDTGTIISAKYMTKADTSDLPAHTLIDLRPDFAEHAKPEDILVAGRNFGCGSSREHAPFVLKKRVACVIADSFARIFYRSAVNLALHVIELPGATESIKEGDTVSVDLDGGKIRNLTSGQSFDIHPMPEFMKRIYDMGGLYSYIGERMKTEPRFTMGDANE